MTSFDSDLDKMTTQDLLTMLRRLRNIAASRGLSIRTIIHFETVITMIADDLHTARALFEPWPTRPE